MPVEEGTIRESLPGQGAESVEDPLDWSEAERRALSGEADAEEAETTPLRTVEETKPETDASDGEGEATGPAVSGSGEKDPGAFVDTRERKESYTPEEWGRLVRQRDYFQRTNQELKDEISTVSSRVEQLGEILTKEPEAPVPDKADDPAGYLERKIDATSEKIDQVTETLEERNKREEMVRGQHEFERAASNAQGAHAQATGQTEEQFVGKMIALRQDRYQDFMEEGYNEREAYNLTIGWEQTMIAKSFQRGENPATVFDRRFARRGLTAQAPGTADTPSVPSQKEPRPGTPGPTATELVERAQEGQKAVSLPRGEGKSRSFKVTYATLASLSPEEFEEVMSQIDGTSKEDELDMTGSTSVVLK